MSDQTVLLAQQLGRSYGSVVAVADFSVTVGAGEVVALVGPNGCGKTTSVEMALGLRKADTGTSRILGLDPRRDARALARVVGISLQGAALHARVTLREQMQYLRAVHAARLQTEADATDVVDLLGLGGVMHRSVGRLSGGLQRRALVATALAGLPRLAVLDEPTSGVDLESRLQLWSAVRHLVDRHATAVLVTTHDLLEAQEQADRVVVMREGRVVADGTPAAVIALSGLRAVVTGRFDAAVGAPSGAVVIHTGGATATMGFADAGTAHAWVERQRASGVGDISPDVRAPSLQEAYLVLARTGSAAPAGGAAGAATELGSGS